MEKWKKVGDMKSGRSETSTSVINFAEFEPYCDMTKSHDISTCSWTRIYENFETKTLIAKFEKIKKSKDCLKKCKVMFTHFII